MQPARTFFARMDFVEMGSALRMPYAQLTLRAIPRMDPNFDTCHPLRTDCGDVVGVICHTSTDTLCPIIG